MAGAPTSARGQWRHAIRCCSSFLLVMASAGLLSSCGGGGGGDDVGRSGALPPPGGGSGSASVTLAWDAVTTGNPAGYRVYYGTSTGAYSQTPGNGLDAGTATIYTVTGLSTGTRYYFAATAHDALGHESDYSNEVFQDIP